MLSRAPNHRNTRNTRRRITKPSKCTSYSSCDKKLNCLLLTLHALSTHTAAHSGYHLRPLCPGGHSNKGRCGLHFGHICSISIQIESFHALEVEEVHTSHPGYILPGTASHNERSCSLSAIDGQNYGSPSEGRTSTVTYSYIWIYTARQICPILDSVYAGHG